MEELDLLRKALTITYNLLVELLEVLEHEQGLSAPVEEAIRRADSGIADVPLSLMGR